jgi:hypothetical protein
VICEAIGLKAQNSADYIQLYSGDKETLVSSLECIQRTSTEILAAIVPSEWTDKSEARDSGPLMLICRN